MIIFTTHIFRMFRAYRNEIIIASYFFILCLQFVAHRFGKIFPSFVFPAFSLAPVIKESVPFNIIHLYGLKQNGDMTEINVKHFFNSGYPDYVNYYLGTVLSNEEKYSSNDMLSEKRKDFIEFSKKQLNRINPDEVYLGIKIERNNNAYYTQLKEIKENVIKPESIIIRF